MEYAPTTLVKKNKEDKESQRVDQEFSIRLGPSKPVWASNYLFGSNLILERSL